MQIQQSDDLKEGQCGGCGSTDESVVDNTCKECRWIDFNQLTTNEQDMLDALEYAYNWIY